MAGFSVWAWADIVGLSMSRETGQVTERLNYGLPGVGFQCLSTTLSPTSQGIQE